MRELAEEIGVPSLLLEDGDILSLSPGRPEVVDSAPVGRQVADGGRLVPAAGRRDGAPGGGCCSMASRSASLAVDEAGRLRGRAAAERARAAGPGRALDTARVAREFGEMIADLPAPLRRERRGAGGGGEIGAAAAAGRSGCRSGRWWMCICCGGEG